MRMALKVLYFAVVLLMSLELCRGDLWDVDVLDRTNVCKTEECKIADQLISFTFNHKTYLALDLDHQHLRTILLPANFSLLLPHLQLSNLIPPRLCSLTFMLYMPVHHNIWIFSWVCRLRNIAYWADGCYAVENVCWRH
jgi:hypothetical protein